MRKKTYTFLLGGALAALAAYAATDIVGPGQVGGDDFAISEYNFDDSGDASSITTIEGVYNEETQKIDMTAGFPANGLGYNEGLEEWSAAAFPAADAKQYYTMQFYVNGSSVGGEMNVAPGNTVSLSYSNATPGETYKVKARSRIYDSTNQVKLQFSEEIEVVVPAEETGEDVLVLVNQSNVEWEGMQLAKNEDGLYAGTITVPTTPFYFKLKTKDGVKYGTNDYNKQPSSWCCWLYAENLPYEGSADATSYTADDNWIMLEMGGKSLDITFNLDTKKITIALAGDTPVEPELPASLWIFDANFQSVCELAGDNGVYTGTYTPTVQNSGFFLNASNELDMSDLTKLYCATGLNEMNFSSTNVYTGEVVQCDAEGDLFNTWQFIQGKDDTFDIIVNLNDMTITVTKQAAPVTYPEALYLYDFAGNNVATLTSTEEGLYSCAYEPATALEGFFFSSRADIDLTTEDMDLVQAYMESMYMSGNAYPGNVVSSESYSGSVIYGETFDYNPWEYSVENAVKINFTVNLKENTINVETEVPAPAITEYYITSSNGKTIYATLTPSAENADIFTCDYNITENTTFLLKDSNDGFYAPTVANLYGYLCKLESIPSDASVFAPTTNLASCNLWCFFGIRGDVVLEVNAADMTLTVKEAAPAVTYPEALYLYDFNGNNVATLTSTEEGLYSCSYQPETPLTGFFFSSRADIDLTTDDMDLVQAYMESMYMSGNAYPGNVVSSESYSGSVIYGETFDYNPWEYSVENAVKINFTVNLKENTINVETEVSVPGDYPENVYLCEIVNNSHVATFTQVTPGVYEVEYKIPANEYNSNWSFFIQDDNDNGDMGYGPATSNINSWTHNIGTPIEAYTSAYAHYDESMPIYWRLQDICEYTVKFTFDMVNGTLTTVVVNTGEPEEKPAVENVNVNKNAGTNKIEVTWDAPEGEESNIDSYNIYIYADGEDMESGEKKTIDAEGDRYAEFDYPDTPGNYKVVVETVYKDGSTSKSEPKDINMTGINGLFGDDADVEYYDLQGNRVVNPDNGIYIRRANGKVEKVLVK